ncbi:MAG: hypothetical protein U9N30_03765, partial [Campylobacterota bacterium]|nr:hypothetical protein [Campylobacterota bacterium]
TLIDSELLTKDIDAQLDYIDEKTQNIILKNPTYVDFSIKHRAEVRVQPDENFKFIINDAHGKIETKVIDCSVKAISVEIAHLPKDFEQNKKIAVSIGFEMKHSKTFDIKNRDYIGTYATVFKILQDNGTNKLILNFELKKSDEELLGKYIYQRQIELVQELKHLIKN